MVDPDEIILDCYRLAERFHQNPETFTEMPLSRLNNHIKYTIRLVEAQNKARARNDD